MQASDAPALLRRARPLLGTLVTIQADNSSGSHAAIEAAFAAIAVIEQCMSAHDTGSDLAKLAHAQAGDVVAVHAHTAAVLRLARDWQHRSAGGFDAQAAGQVLAQRGQRPAIASDRACSGTLAGSTIDAQGRIHVDGPLALDLGGIAKGYAVDHAVAVLQSQGVRSALVNAGGDLRAFGTRTWSVEVLHPLVRTRARRLVRLRDAAVASSVRGTADDEFVATRRRPAQWQSSTVLARDCVTADAFTKWALQAPAHSQRLRAALSRFGAHAWRA